jgi:hypothetical protein
MTGSSDVIPLVSLNAVNLQCAHGRVSCARRPRPGAAPARSSGLAVDVVGDVAPPPYSARRAASLVKANDGGGGSLGKLIPTKNERGAGLLAQTKTLSVAVESDQGGLRPAMRSSGGAALLSIPNLASPGPSSGGGTSPSSSRRNPRHLRPARP